MEDSFHRKSFHQSSVANLPVLIAARRKSFRMSRVVRMSRKNSKTNEEVLEESLRKEHNNESESEQPSSKRNREFTPKKAKQKESGDFLPESYQSVRTKFYERYDNEDEFFSLTNEIEFTNLLDYVNIRKNDIQHQEINNFNWSGDDVVSFNDEKVINGLKSTLMHEEKIIWLPGFFGMIKICRNKAKNFVEGSFFNNFVLLVVILNTTLLASTGLVLDENTVVSDLSFVCTIIFIVEMGLKLIGLGIKGYARDGMNLFDGLIVLLSIGELTVLSGERAKLLVHLEQ